MMKEGILIPMALAAGMLVFAACDNTSGGEKIYGERYYQNAYSIKSTSDGGTVIAADTVTASGRYADMYIIKTDAQGAKKWSKVIGGEGEDIAYDVVVAKDGGFVAAGVSETPAPGDNGSFWDTGEARLVKFSATGAVLWDRMYGFPNVRDTFKSVGQTADGGYIATGYTGKSEDQTGGILIVKTDANGNAQWVKNLGTSAVTDLAEGIKQTADGGYLIGGTSSDGPNSDPFIMKIDGAGNLLWSKSYGVPELDEMVEDLQLTADGGCIMAGYETADWYSGTTRAAWAMKTDAQGNVQWRTLVGGAVWDGFNSVQLTKDGGYVLAGETRTYGNREPYENDFLVVKLNGAGAQVWLKAYGTGNDDYAESVACLSTGGYAVVGNTFSGILNAMDVYLIKLNADGNE